MVFEIECKEAIMSVEYRSPCGVVANVLNCGIVVYEFELQLRNDVLFPD